MYLRENVFLILHGTAESASLGSSHPTPTSRVEEYMVFAAPIVEHVKIWIFASLTVNNYSKHFSFYLLNESTKYIRYTDPKGSGW